MSPRGAGGTTIHYARGRTLSSHGCLAQMAVVQVLVEMRLPLIDLPVVAVGHDPDPPLSAYAARARALEAVVANPPAGTARPVV